MTNYTLTLPKSQTRSFLIHDQIIDKSNTLGVTSRVGTAYSSGAQAFFLWLLHYLSWLFILIYTSFYHILSILSKYLKYFYNCIAYNWSFTRVTRRVSLVEQQLPTRKEHMSSPRDYWDSCCSYVTIALVL